MANVRIEQRNAHLANAIRLEAVTTRDGEVSKGTVTAISNRRTGNGEDEPTAIQWTLWGKQAENAARYLTTGSHVNVTGRLKNDVYKDGAGNTVFGFSFTVEEIDYLDTRAEGEARRQQEAPAVKQPAPAASQPPKARRGRKASPDTAVAGDDIPF